MTKISRLLSLCALTLATFPATGAEVQLLGSWTATFSGGSKNHIDFTGRVGDCFTGKMSATGSQGWSSTFVCPTRSLQKGESTAILKDNELKITFLDGTFYDITIDPGGWLNSVYKDPKANAASPAIFYRNN